MPNLLLVHIGPVQGFIASARRSRDLWFGSWMLSELSKTAARTIADRYGVESLIFPAPERTEDLDSNSSVKVANKVLAYIESELGDTPQQVERAVRTYLDAIAGRAFDLAARDGGAQHFRRTDAEVQVRDLPEIYWVVIPCADVNKYHAARAYLEALMAARKNTRYFVQPKAWALPTPKSSLDGQRESVIDETLYAQAAREGEAGVLPGKRLFQYFKARRAERLSGVDLMKRLGNPDPRSLSASADPVATFPSTSHVAALPVIHRLKRMAAENRRILHHAKTYVLTLETYLASEAVEPLSGTFAVPELAFHDGSILYEARLREDAHLTEDGLQAIGAARRQFLRDALGSEGEPSPYYMVLQGDGDRMGSVIDALETPDAHREFSQVLSRFSIVVRDVVEAFDGVLVYAGGDDVLAFLPLDTGLACACTIAEIFRVLLGAFTNRDGERPTFSAGLVIAHHLESLSQTIKLVHAAEKAAKGVPDKDALAITLSKRSGADRTVAGHWEMLAPQMEQFIALALADRMPAGAAYDLHNLAVRLDVAVDPAFLTIQEKEVERILKRKRGQHGAAPLRGQALNVLGAPDDEKLIDALLSHVVPHTAKAVEAEDATNGQALEDKRCKQGKVDKVKQFADALVIADLLADAQLLSGRTSAELAALRAAELEKVTGQLRSAQTKGADHE